MEILYLLIPLGVVLAFASGAAFWLAVEAGQFDDLEGPGLSVVVDDDAPCALPHRPGIPDGLSSFTFDADQSAQRAFPPDWPGEINKSNRELQ